MLAERVNLWAAVPTMYWALLQYVRGQPGRRRRDAAAHAHAPCCSGGAPMPVEVHEAVRARRFGVRILEGYGLSETSPVATFNHVERPSQAGHGGAAGRSASRSRA